MKKVCILHTGGCVAMQKNEEGILIPTLELQKQLEMYVPGLRKIASIDHRYLFQLDSSDFNPRHWKIIADTIAEEYSEYDGFVILHGSDTMSYSATILSFMLGNLGKPVILTDSLLPIAEPHVDNHANILNAVRFACEDVGEVAIMYGNSLVRGNRSKKTHELAVNSFTSPNFPPIGLVDIKLELSENRFHCHGKPLELHTNIVTDTVVIKLFPGITNEHVLGMVPPRTKGVVIEGYGAGNIPLGHEGIQEALQHIAAQDIILAIDTQCIYGGVQYDRFAGGYFTKKLGALSTHDMTAEASIMKLMWVLGQTEEHTEIQRLYENNLVGELTKSNNGI